MSSTKLNTRFLLTLSLLVDFISCSRLLDYDDDCTNAKKCDISKFLICVNGKCQCENPSTMFYDERVHTCAAKLNETCYLEEVWSRGTSIHNQMIGTTGDENGKCNIPNESSPYMDVCDYDEKKCPDKTGLKCVNGRCHCGSDFYKYFNGSNCISLAYGPCDKKSDCTPFSDCIKWDGYPGRCECSKGFMRTKMGKCERGPGQACNDNGMTCNEEDGLKCVNGKCQCPDELQFYSNAYGCLSLVGGKCYLSRGRYQDNCISGAYCEDLFRGGSFGACKCQDGYMATVDRSCRKK